MWRGMWLQERQSECGEGPKGWVSVSSLIRTSLGDVELKLAWRASHNYPGLTPWANMFRRSAAEFVQSDLLERVWDEVVADAPDVAILLLPNPR